MGKRRRAREVAVQVLFHLEYQNGDPGEVFDLLCETFHFGKNFRSFSRLLVVGVTETKQELDDLIRAASRNWRLERMSRLDRCVLRMAVYEMLHMEDIPPKVSIDEAVELGKKFGTEESGGFVNGVLDHVFSTLRHEGRLKKPEAPPEGTGEEGKYDEI
jgi:transcription antitermination factor NusB